jgi:hypothetical protein
MEWSEDTSVADVADRVPMDADTRTIERLPLPPAPPPVRARRFVSDAPPPPPVGPAVQHRRSPQASANPVQLLGPVGMAATSSRSTKTVLAVVAVLIVGGLIITAVMVSRTFQNTTLVNNLETGDCVQDFFTTGANGEFVEIFLVNTTPCGEPHAMEVYARTELLWIDDQYPGVDESFETGQDFCFYQYDRFVGGDYTTSQYEVWTFVPVKGSWSQGDRTVKCLVGHFDEFTLTTGTLQGAGR